MQRLFADFAWLPDGWQADVAIDIDADGQLVAVQAGAAADGRERIGRWVLPGMPNIHSHAFQRAMAGLAERQTDPADSFWTWREVMYGFAQRLDPEALRDIAAQLYVEMLEAGYTAVCEFHYLHHAPDGRPYADPAAMSQAVLAAADDAGIGITLLPTLYMTGGFDGRPLSERQRRFAHGVDDYLALLERLRPQVCAQRALGLCFHSLRAVPEAPMRAVLEAGDKGLPVHIHIAEQQAEVNDCLARHGTRPVRWLLANMPVDSRWSLVHATHLSGEEVHGIAASGAVVALCPTTEANLGDGLFPLRAYLDAGGAWGIGSDSHISVSPVEELRWLEYGQRLALLRRNIAVSAAQPSCGELLLGQALHGGAQASGRAVGRLAPGRRADLIVLDDEAALLAERDVGNLVDTWVFSGNRPLVRDVMVGGRWCVRDGRHRQREAVAMRYRSALRRLRG